MIHRVATGRLGGVTRTVLFLPQVIPLVAAGIIWGWLLSLPGLVNQTLRAVGLGGIARAWLGDFDSALPSVGLIGIWVLLGFCTVLLLAGMTKIDPALFESARIDGAGWWREFASITLPSLRYEIGVCLTVTVVAALAAFDIVYVSTGGGPGNSTAVPGVQIYILAFLERQVGLASALAVLLMLLVVVIVLPIQRLSREERHEDLAGRALFGPGTAGRDDGGHGPAVPQHLDHRAASVGDAAQRARMAGRPAVGQLRRCVQGRQHGGSARVERLHRPRGRAGRPGHRDHGRLRHRAAAHTRRATAAPAVRVRADVAVRGHHHAALLPGAGMGILNTRFAIVLPLIALFMPFGVFWMRAHFANMPSDITEAARVDGANTWSLFWRIHVPLARPAIASLGILLAVWSWNQFLLALVLVEDPSQRTMAGSLGAFQGHYATDIPLLCAGTILILLPTLLVYVALATTHHRGAAAGFRERLRARE